MLKTQKVTVIIIHNTITTGFYTDRSNLSKADRQPALLVLSHFVFWWRCSDGRVFSPFPQITPTFILETSSQSRRQNCWRKKIAGEKMYQTLCFTNPRCFRRSLCFTSCLSAFAVGINWWNQVLNFFWVAILATKPSGHNQLPSNLIKLVFLQQGHRRGDAVQVSPLLEAPGSQNQNYVQFSE